MPDVTELLNNVTALLDSGIKEDMAEGQRAFDAVQRQVQRSIDERMPDVARSLGDVGTYELVLCTVYCALCTR